MSDYYDREGEPIAESKWVELRKDPDYVLICHDVIVGPVIDIEVTTRWRGTAEQYGPTGPMVFFTTVKEGKETSFINYSSEAEALRGHNNLVETNTDDHAEIPRWKQVGGEL